MSLEHLWAGWRAAFVTETPSPRGGCVLCAIGEGEDGADELVVARGNAAYCVLNLYPYTAGHLMVVPLRHVGDVEELEAAEANELWDLVRQGIRALRAVYEPQGLNLGMNLGRAAGAGIADHLHVHVVPRWVGDANFMVTAAQTRVLPEALPATRDKLRRAWPREAGA
jgi:ATP adenylyltransferase